MPLSFYLAFSPRKEHTFAPSLHDYNSDDNEDEAESIKNWNDADEEEEDLLYTDAYEGMKLRSKSRHGSGDSGDNNGSIARKADEEDPLKWIEENIPESENPLPIIPDIPAEDTSKKTDDEGLNYNVPFSFNFFHPLTNRNRKIMFPLQRPLRHHNFAYLYGSLLLFSKPP